MREGAQKGGGRRTAFPPPAKGGLVFFFFISPRQRREEKRPSAYLPQTGPHSLKRARWGHKGGEGLHSQRQARVVALAAAGGAVAHLARGGVEERPDEGEHDGQGPALGAGHAERLAGALAGEAVVDLKEMGGGNGNA